MLQISVGPRQGDLTPAERTRLVISRLVISRLVVSRLVVSRLVVSGLVVSGLVISGIVISGIVISGIVISTQGIIGIDGRQLHRRHVGAPLDTLALLADHPDLSAVHLRGGVAPVAAAGGVLARHHDQRVPKGGGHGHRAGGLTLVLQIHDGAICVHLTGQGAPAGHPLFDEDTVAVGGLGTIHGVVSRETSDERRRGESEQQDRAHGNLRSCVWGENNLRAAEDQKVPEPWESARMSPRRAENWRPT